MQWPALARSADTPWTTATAILRRNHGSRSSCADLIVNGASTLMGGADRTAGIRCAVVVVAAARASSIGLARNPLNTKAQPPGSAVEMLMFPGVG